MLFQRACMNSIFKCDNCENKFELIKQDITGYAQAILRIVRDLAAQGREVRPVVVNEIFRGGKGKSAAEFTQYTIKNTQYAL